MLGRLLHLGSGGAPATQTSTNSTNSRHIAALESVQEDAHTRSLLYPDAQALHMQRHDQVFPLSAIPGANPTASSTSAFDYSEDVDLDIRDVRVIIMQDALGLSNSSLLFDSQSQSPSQTLIDRSPPGNPDGRRNNASSRKSSLGLTTRPVVGYGDISQALPGLYDRRTPGHNRRHSFAETDGQRASRVYREELATFASCIFGSSELMSYKGTSTKVHVIPSESRPGDQGPLVGGDGRSSIGRSGGRSSKLSQSFSSQAYGPPSNSQPGAALAGSRLQDRKRVLITRLFPVNLPNDEEDLVDISRTRFTDENTGFPFPASSEEAKSPKKRTQPKQKRTPMYAVALVIRLSPSTNRGSGPNHSRSAFRDSSSYKEEDFFPSSYGSTRPYASSMAGSGLFGEATESSWGDGEDRIDILTQHWDIITRTLTHLQSVVATTLSAILKKADAASPDPTFSSTSSNAPTAFAGERRSAELPRTKPPKSTKKLVALPPNCLSDNPAIAEEVGIARGRIVTGLSANRVVTGQGRWGIWRDEAIWTFKWAVTQEHRQFVYNLVTAFLATHKGWMQALCPPSLKKGLLLGSGDRNGEDILLPSRTIIVSNDKMAARRLVFLLSAFLPAAGQLTAPSRSHRPSTSYSAGIFSHSPPSFIVPVLREESLRRKINRRTNQRRASHSRTGSQSIRASVPPSLVHIGDELSHARRDSDAASIRTMSIQMPGTELISKKSSAITTTTVTPDSTAPHFTSVQREERRIAGLVHSESAAADDLKRSLQKVESAEVSNPVDAGTKNTGSRWGDVFNGLWGSKRPKSQPPTPGESPRHGDRSESNENNPLESGLPDISRDSSSSEEPRTPTISSAVNPIGSQTLVSPQEDPRGGGDTFSRPNRTPDPTGAFESPVKTSINAEDGVIDVDVPFPDYIMSFESAISSPSSSGYLSTPGISVGQEHFETSSRLSSDSDPLMNAAGWLKSFHPDFAIQAIPPEDDLMEKVRATLRAEPTPLLPRGPGLDMPERWIVAGTVLVADTTSNTVTRVTYKRLVKQRTNPERTISGASSAPGVYASALLTPSTLPYETPLREEWIEEPVTKADPALVMAIDKVTDDSVDSGDSSSTGSPRDALDGATPTAVRTSFGSTAQPPLDTQVPRVQCKKVILSALENVIRSVLEQSDHSGSRRSGLEPDNVLRATVREWMSELDGI